MPMLDDRRHEQFAQLVVQGVGQTKAYVAAGFKKHAGNASALAKRAAIAQRIAELKSYGTEGRAAVIAAVQAEAVAGIRKTVVTRQYLIDQALELVKEAREHGRTSAAVAALKELGILTGHRVERAEQGSPGDFEKMSEEELIARLKDTGFDMSKLN